MAVTIGDVVLVRSEEEPGEPRGSKSRSRRGLVAVPTRSRHGPRVCSVTRAFSGVARFFLEFLVMFSSLFSFFSLHCFR